MFAWSANRSVCNRHHLKLPSFLSRFRLAKHNDVEIVLIFLLKLKRLEQLWYKIWLAGISYADNSVCYESGSQRYFSEMVRRKSREYQ